jgi:hypothetical protein
MLTSPGITQKRLSAEPLATESEASAGPSHLNPYRSVREAELVEEIERKERQRQDSQLFKTGTSDGGGTGGVDHPLQSNSNVDDPTGGSDPFAFDDIDPQLPAFGDSDPFGLEALDPMNDKGPQF